MELISLTAPPPFERPEGLLFLPPAFTRAGLEAHLASKHLSRGQTVMRTRGPSYLCRLGPGVGRPGGSLGARQAAFWNFVPMVREVGEGQALAASHRPWAVRGVVIYKKDCVFPSLSQFLAGFPATLGSSWSE